MGDCVIQNSFNNYKKAFKITLNKKYKDFINNFNGTLLNHLKTLRGKNYDVANYVKLVNEVINENNSVSENKFELITEELVNSLLSQSQVELKISSSVIPELDISKRAPIYVYKKSTIAYNYMIGNFKSELVNSVYLNKEQKKYVSDDAEINKNLVNYKNNLFNTLIDYINTSNGNTELPQTLLYREDGTIDSDSYAKIMKDAFRLFNYTAETFESNIFSSESAKSKYDAFNAMFLLNNFDAALKLKSALGNAVNINESDINKLNGISNKYSVKNSVLQTAFFSDDNHKSKDSMLSSSPLIKLISDTIPYYDKNGKKIEGEYLGIARFVKLGNLIQELDFSNILGEDIVFNENPAKFIKELVAVAKTLSKENTVISKET